MPIIGHQTIRTHLAELIRKNKFPQTSIFYGAEGVGKKLVACEVAEKLLTPPSPSSQEGVFPKSPLLARGGWGSLSHSDLFLIEPTAPKSSSGSEKTKSTLRSNWTIKIEQLNELKTKLTHHPLVGDYQIVVIDEADKMTVSSANTLLKTIEEPRSSQVFILITSRLGHVLPTLRSRSVKFHFSGLSLSEIQNILQGSGYADLKSVNSETLAFFHDCFSGSVSMIQRAINSRIDTNVFKEMLSLTGQFDGISRRIKELLKDDIDLDVFLHCFRTYCLRKKNAGQSSTTEINRLLKRAQRAEQQLTKHIPAEFVLENLFM